MEKYYSINGFEIIVYVALLEIFYKNLKIKI